MKFSKRMEHFGTGIFSILAEKKAARLSQGKDVIDLSIGAPNIPPAPHIMEALIKAAGEKENYLYAIQDTDELRNAAAAWYQRRYGVILDPQKEIVAVMGSQEGLSHFALTIVDEGDTVLVPDPCYPVFADGPVLAGAKLHYMPQREENGYVIDLKEIPEEVARRAKLMVVSYPNNPTTVVAPDSFYEELIEGIYGKTADMVTAEELQRLRYLSIRNTRDTFFVDFSFGDPYGEGLAAVQSAGLEPKDWDTDDLANFPNLEKLELS